MNMKKDMLKMDSKNMNKKKKLIIKISMYNKEKIIKIKILKKEKKNKLI